MRPVHVVSCASVIVVTALFRASRHAEGDSAKKASVADLLRQRCLRAVTPWRRRMSVRLRGMRGEDGNLPLQ